MGATTLEIKIRSGRKAIENSSPLPCVEATDQNCPKQKVQITSRVKILQVTPLVRHFYGNGSIPIQH